jgi:hypothetical protein
MSEITGWEEFTASLARKHGEGFLADFCKTIVDEQRAEEEMAFASQRRIADATRRLEECYFDGLGECHMRLDPTVFFHWVRKEGREVWNDKNFIKAFKRDNKDVIVRAKSRKTMIGYGT